MMLKTLTFAILSAAFSCVALSKTDGALLFSLSGENGVAADYAKGGRSPTFVNDVSVLDRGFVGKALSCADIQRLAYNAPGNIYAQRGTVSFFWRSRYAVGPTEFPIFRVGYADHSSWDMVWLRIDYNGHGFDAFVTDTGLARTRVSVNVSPFPWPEKWTHLAFSWDESSGVRFYINGVLVATKSATAVLDAGLDQFGLHSRCITPHNVQSDYNYTRGGDLDELRVYDHMLTDKEVEALARADYSETLAAAPHRGLGDPVALKEWGLQNGWSEQQSAPPELKDKYTAIRKVEIHEAYDLKRWWWKANDGIRETTWPGVYNRSAIEGRKDYFILPDWDCYVESGKAITFVLPEEPWNHIEINGAAWGSLDMLAAESTNDGKPVERLFNRPRGFEKTVHRLPRVFQGQKIRFTNVEQERPIEELGVYYVYAGKAPSSFLHECFKLSKANIGGGSVTSIVDFVTGRYPSDERSMIVGSATNIEKPAPARNFTDNDNLNLPIVHVILPNDGQGMLARSDIGIDGLSLDLPPIDVPATDGLISMNIRVKDPLWPARDMMDFTFSVRPNEAKTLWLDIRDRIIPAGKPIYLTISCSSQRFDTHCLEGAEVSVYFKPREQARVEHEADRFTQVRDVYGMVSEERPRDERFKLWNRFKADISDLMSVNPNHIHGSYYYADGVTGVMPEFDHGKAPEGVPLWAYRQTQLLGHLRRMVLWWIDNRQVPYGDFGGGICDDDDMTNMWPGIAFMGVEPDKIRQSLHKLLEAAYRNGMITDGLPTNQCDELHSYEEGINCIGQNLILDYGNPQQIERAMEVTRALQKITAINRAGHRHFISSYFSASRISVEFPWGSSKPLSYLYMQPCLLLANYNGDAAAKKLTLELADGLIPHLNIKVGYSQIPTAVEFSTDREFIATRGYVPWAMFWCAWKWTNDPKYLTQISTPTVLVNIGTAVPNVFGLDKVYKQYAMSMLSTVAPKPASSLPQSQGSATSTGRGRARSRLPYAGWAGHAKWVASGDVRHLEETYKAQLDECKLTEYIMTEGSIWTDRVEMPYTEIQRARLGGVALFRNGLIDGHTVGWRFHAPSKPEDVGILVSDQDTTHFKVTAFNLSDHTVKADLFGWNIDPGIWLVTQTVEPDSGAALSREVDFERSKSITVEFAPRVTTHLTFTLKTKGKPYTERPDIAMSAEDVHTTGKGIRLTIHNLGSVPTNPATAQLLSKTGRIIATAPIPPIPAADALIPQHIVIDIPLSRKAMANVNVINLVHHESEITTLNNRVVLDVVLTASPNQ